MGHIGLMGSHKAQKTYKTHTTHSPHLALILGPTRKKVQPCAGFFHSKAQGHMLHYTTVPHGAGMDLREHFL